MKSQFDIEGEEAENEADVGMGACSDFTRDSANGSSQQRWAVASGGSDEEPGAGPGPETTGPWRAGGRAPQPGRSDEVLMELPEP
mmetsp:Transcript_98025/g.297585  ORF Transcript_98025/g.297585 Transcript_98025/m.297585 type:complete len:85 (-) Transcript_98025:103-357(-)